jgi:hypothetical protein
MTASIIKFPPAFQVDRSITRIVTVGGKQWRVFCEDWGDAKTAELAMDDVITFARATQNPDPDWDSLADLIMVKQKIPADAVLGCSIIAEPI